MKIIDTTTHPARRPPVPNAPVVQPLVTDSLAAVLRVTLPAGAGLPEHDHGPSAVTLIPLRGRARVSHNGTKHDLDPTTAAHIDIGERVALDNPGTEAATLLVIATPPEFAATITSWPAHDEATQPAEHS
jgi:quercetin dioxygenase-like cupin family protein